MQNNLKMWRFYEKCFLTFFSWHFTLCFCLSIFHVSHVLFVCSTINMQNNFKNVTFFWRFFLFFFSWQFRLTFSSMDVETAARLAVRGGLLQAADHEQFKLSVEHNGCKSVRRVGNPVHTLHSDCVVVCQRL